MKGKMKNFAHPLKDSKGIVTGWCNEPPEQAQTENKPAPKPEVIPPEKPIPVTEKQAETFTRRNSTDEKIAEQVAVKAVVEMAGSGVLTIDSPLIIAVKQWCSDKLSNYLPPALSEHQVSSDKPLETQRSDNQTDKDILIGLVMNHLKYKDAKTAISWLKNVAKIDTDRLENEPKEVAKELIESMRWK